VKRDDEEIQGRKDNTYFINPLSLITIKEICGILKISQNTLLAIRRSGSFPKPINLNETSHRSFKRCKRKYWKFQDVINWINSREDIEE
jgi:predicted DNA-binding transcriptional regulator AlpA